jgi:guanylate kinase
MSELLGKTKQGLVFVMSAPAGTGKTTLLHMLLDEFPGVVESISCTTRPPRPGEVDGEHYHFLTGEEFDRRIERGEFLEHAEVFGIRYGTSRKIVDDLLAKGKHVFMVLDTQGALAIQKQMEAVFIFLSAPSRDEQHRRLVERKTESEEMIERRLAWAAHELEQINAYDYHIVNDNLNAAYQSLRAVFIAETHKVANLEE